DRVSTSDSWPCSESLVRAPLLIALLREKYGDVFTVHLGPRPVVMLCGTEAIREALVDQAEAFSGRGTVAVLEPIVQGYGVFFANGERWKTLRRFSLSTMRDFGMGKRSVEKQIQEEARCLVEELRKSQGDLRGQCGGGGKKGSEAEKNELDKEMFELFSGFLKYFPGAHKQIFKKAQEIIDYIGHNVEKHQATLDPSNPRDFIDTYLIRMEKTSSTTLRYGFLLMLKYPHVAEKVQKEIDQVIGSHRPPTLDDRTKMPYTDAVIHEIQRFSDLGPIGLPHKVTKDTLFRGYLLPKNTEVYPILSAALHDPRYFEQPDTFNPDHFLDANGALKKNEAFMPFSIGERDLCFLSQTLEGRLTLQDTGLGP
ncbi:cytochrome P450 2B19-like, partial [Microtus ochrogaster]|uniref:Cytochrome P450 2B19-like n=1 Tax=Microtus ochrogaster TaxID=79684 RepID=A0ABM1AYR2_MICOH